MTSVIFFNVWWLSWNLGYKIHLLDNFQNWTDETTQWSFKPLYHSRSPSGRFPHYWGLWFPIVEFVIFLVSPFVSFFGCMLCVGQFGVQACMNLIRPVVRLRLLVLLLLFILDRSSTNTLVYSMLWSLEFDQQKSLWKFVHQVNVFYCVNISNGRYVTMCTSRLIMYYIETTAKI